MSKQSRILVGVAVAAVVGGILWFGYAVLNDYNPEAAGVTGNKMRVDVVAPKEPEVVNNGDPLSVGDLANSYNHEETMARVDPESEAQEDIGTSWDDQAWVDGTGSATADVEASPPITEKSVKTTKVPSGYEE